MAWLNLAVKTLGGRQFWGDIRFFRGWRIQRHVLSNHYRLLDPHDVRKAWGSLAECEATLQQERERQQLTPMAGTAVVALHGILRSSKVWNSLKQEVEQDGMTVVAADYPSTQQPITAFVDQLQELLSSLEGIERIHLVVHSMGGLIVRAWSQRYSDPRIRRLVMIGTPNRGAEIASMLRENPIFQFVFGPAGQQLVHESHDEFIQKLPTPPMEFAVIAGSRGNSQGFNPLIPGDDDGIVTTASARLPGAVDYLPVRVLHSFLPLSSEVVAATRRFLATGALRESGIREPIPAGEGTTSPAAEAAQ